MILNKTQVRKILPKNINNLIQIAIPFYTKRNQIPTIPKESKILIKQDDQKNMIKIKKKQVKKQDLPQEQQKKKKFKKQEYKWAFEFQKFREQKQLLKIKQKIKKQKSNHIRILQQIKKYIKQRNIEIYKKYKHKCQKHSCKICLNRIESPQLQTRVLITKNYQFKYQNTTHKQIINAINKLQHLLSFKKCKQANYLNQFRKYQKLIEDLQYEQKQFNNLIQNCKVGYNKINDLIQELKQYQKQDIQILNISPKHVSQTKTCQKKTTEFQKNIEDNIKLNKMIIRRKQKSDNSLKENESIKQKKNNFWKKKILKYRKIKTQNQCDIKSDLYQINQQKIDKQYIQEKLLTKKSANSLCENQKININQKKQYQPSKQQQTNRIFQSSHQSLQKLTFNHSSRDQKIQNIIDNNIEIEKKNQLGNKKSYVKFSSFSTQKNKITFSNKLPQQIINKKIKQRKSLNTHIRIRSQRFQNRQSLSDLKKQQKILQQQQDQEQIIQKNAKTQIKFKKNDRISFKLYKNKIISKQRLYQIDVNQPVEVIRQNLHYFFKKNNQINFFAKQKQIFLEKQKKLEDLKLKLSEIYDKNPYQIQKVNLQSMEWLNDIEFTQEINIFKYENNRRSSFLMNLELMHKNKEQGYDYSEQCQRQDKCRKIERSKQDERRQEFKKIKKYHTQYNEQYCNKILYQYDLKNYSIII